MEQIFYVGNYASNGIDILSFSNGDLQYLSSTNHFSNCSFVCQTDKAIYHVIEMSEDMSYPGGYVVAYNKASLTLLNYEISYGNGPCFVTIDYFRNILYLGNYGDGSLTAFLLDKNGKIEKKLLHISYTNHSRIHCISFSKDFQYLFVVDLGNNELIAYQIEFSNDALELLELSRFSFPNFSEPRHMVVNSSNQICIVTESSCEIYLLSFSKENGFNLLSRTSLLPEGVKKLINYTGCAIKTNQKHSFIYASIRGYNHISVFEWKNNRLHRIQTISCFGQTPRDISFDISGNFLLCANQDSNSISIFNVDMANGLLTYNHTFPSQTPSCLIASS